MKAFRFSFLALGAAAVFALTLAAVVPNAQACPGSEGACACGADKAAAGEKADECGGCEKCKAAKAAGADTPCDKSDGKCACAKGADGEKADECGSCEACKAAKAAGEDLPCKKEDGKCACGKNADGKAAPCDKKDGKCGCSKGEGEEPEGKPETGAAGTGASQIAVLDPATGEVTTPTAAQFAAATPSGARAAQSDEAAPPIARHEDGGVQAPFPSSRESRVVASVNESGEAHAGCAH